MKLSQAVSLYITRRRSEGAQFVSTEIILKSFWRYCGEIELADLSSDRVAEYLRSSQAALATVASRASAIKCFVEYWAARDQMATIYLQKAPKARTIRLPYIFTRQQLRMLLVSAQKRCCPQDGFDGATMRIVLLLLYATGTMVEEVLSLRKSDVDLTAACIRFTGNLRRGSRTLPIGMELVRELSKFLESSRNKALQDDLLFCCIDGRKIRPRTLWYRFAKLHKTVGLTKTVAGHEPRLHDLKFTFAVHRLSLSIQRGEELNRIVPALSTYLGYTSLTKAEEYLAFVPERFNDDLRKLSPTVAPTRWRDIPNLLNDLNSL